MKAKKIVSLSYEKRSFFYHPETKEEFEGIANLLSDAIKAHDHNSIVVYAMQLIPDKIACEK